ncbi:hypothetical protein ABZS88_45330 [Streptomyces sp. NPDC005480]|uniref:hypothetical protein n=1 Tax=Streptomyces sp. NPDC005480 TaxID=3154880 RepID=UPI0033AC2EC4
MDSPKNRTSQLEALFQGAFATPPHTQTSTSVIRVTAPVPDELDEDVRRTLLAELLATADRFGHTAAPDGSTLWAEVDRSQAAGRGNS